MRTSFRLFTALGLALAATAGSLLARGGGGCLSEGTLVATPQGEIPIERLRVGDTVWSEAEGRRCEARVIATARVEPESFVELTSAGNHVVLATAEHPFAVDPGVFLRAGLLNAGDTLLSWTGGEPLAGARTVPADRPAHDLLVAPGGVFFANGILVHNKGCFLPDTPILLADGSPRPIAEIRPGDTVLAFDAEGRTVPARVANILTHEVAGYLVIRTERVELRVTDEHPFYVGDGMFKTVGALHVGDTVYAHDGAGHLTPQRLQAIERVESKATVYNLQTAEPHTYFADGIAVHNKGGGCFAAGTRIATPDGERAIETLAVGDLVLSPTADGTLVPTEVRGIYLNFAPLLTLHTDRGTLRTTDEHPLRRASGEFARANTFAEGDTLAAATGLATVLEIERGTESQPVFNLSVDDPHTFLADGFVAHNKGGGGFHGGGYHGGSHYSGGGTDAPPAIILIVIGGIVVFVLIIKAREQSDTGNEELDYSFSRSAIERKSIKTQKLLEFIAKVDEAWLPEKLANTAHTTFTRLQRCWSAREYAPMQELLMPDLYRQHCAQLDGMQRTHELNVLDRLSVDAVDIVQVQYTERPADRSFTALITARARDYYIDDRTHGFIRGDAEPARFQEFWTFQQVGSCWRLREIEQTRESDALTTENLFEQFTDTGRDQIYGDAAGTSGPAGPALPDSVMSKDQKIDRLLNFLVCTDRIWNRDEMLASARRVFLNVVLAWQDGRPETLAGIALVPTMVEHLRSVTESNRRTGTTVEFRNLCVRKVEIVHVDNRDDRALDNFTARISAHAQVIIARNGTELRHDPDVRAWVEYWTFARVDNRWALREILPATEGQDTVARENIDEGSSTQMLEWYYSKTRAT